jgi:hypothetical protein
MAPGVAAHDEWIARVDLKAFGSDVRSLGDALRKGQGACDVDHLHKIVLWNWVFTALGLLTMWSAPNLFTVVCLSTGLFSRWTMIGHHVCHGGYDNTSAAKAGWSRWVFAVGSLARRAEDWFDWMLPEAWNIEHGRLHHYALNESNDPDLVEQNARFLRTLRAPRAVKYAVVLFFALTWKWTYYASNTYSQLLFSNATRELTPLAERLETDAAADAALSSGAPNKSKEKLMEEKKRRHIVTIFSILEGSVPSWWSTWGFLRDAILPFFIFRFLLLPMPCLVLLGKGAFINAVVNMALADLLTNLHSFLTIVTNHAGEDLYWFEDHCEPKSDEFFLRQIIGSADFAAGNDYVDFFHGFLNYQCEHHAWPDLSMLSYQRAHPLLKQICAKHGVPMVQHNVFWRLWKTVQIFVGDNSMRKFDPTLLKSRS